VVAPAKAIASAARRHFYPANGTENLLLRAGPLADRQEDNSAPLTERLGLALSRTVTFCSIYALYLVNLPIVVSMTESRVAAAKIR
jgi:hypothetical protein